MKKMNIKKIGAVALVAAMCITSVNAPVNADAATKKVKSIKLSAKKATLYVKAAKEASQLTLKATIKPSAAKKTKVKWKTSNKKVATVTSKGLVKAKKTGKATITATAGKKKATCKVTVKKISKKVTKVTASKSSVQIRVGASTTVKGKATPSKATLKTLSYKSSNKGVATVTAKGVIKGIKAGKATITIAALDGSKKKATVAVTVVAATSTQQTPVQQVPATQAPAPATQAPVPTTPATEAPATEAPATEAPTQAPTATPTQAPTATPTQAPTATPTQAPTATPTVAPTAEPTLEEIVPKVNGSNLVYTGLTTDKAYTVTGVKNGEAYSKEITVDTINTLLKYEKDYVAKNPSLEQIYNKFVSYSDFSKEITKNFTVAVASSGVADNAKVVTISGSDAGSYAGKYTVTVTDESAGKYHVSVVADATNAQATSVSFDVEKVSATKVEFTNVSFKKNGVTKTKDKVTVDYTISGDKLTAVTVTAGTMTAKMTYADDAYTISVPKTYVDKYELKISCLK